MRVETNALFRKRVARAASTRGDPEASFALARIVIDERDVRRCSERRGANETLRADRASLPVGPVAPGFAFVDWLPPGFEPKARDSTVGADPEVVVAPPDGIDSDLRCLQAVRVDASDALAERPVYVELQRSCDLATRVIVGRVGAKRLVGNERVWRGVDPAGQPDAGPENRQEDRGRAGGQQGLASPAASQWTG